MTDARDAREIAEKMINNSHLNRAYWALTGVDASILAKEHLALLERVEKLELLRFAAVNSPCRHSADVTSASCSVCDALKSLAQLDSEAKT